MRSGPRTLVVEKEYRAIICDNGCGRERIAPSAALTMEEDAAFHAAAKGWIAITRNIDGKRREEDRDFCGMFCLAVWSGLQQVAEAAAAYNSHADGGETPEVQVTA